MGPFGHTVIWRKHNPIQDLSSANRSPGDASRAGRPARTSRHTIWRKLYRRNKMGRIWRTGPVPCGRTSIR